MTRQPPRLVSVIVPTYDPYGFLEYQLSALAEQDYQDDWEVLVVDNRSPTPVESVVSRFLSRMPVRYVRAYDGQGISYARNVGIAEAKGELLAFCDCDDEVTATWLSELVKASASADVVAGTNERSKLNDPDAHYWHELAQPKPGPAHDFLPIASGSNMSVWRDVIDDIGSWDPRFDAAGEDCDFSWRAILNGYQLVKASEPQVHYRFRATLWAFMKQHFTRGTTEPLLYAVYRNHGMPQSSTRIAMKTWGSLIYRLPFAIFSPRWRAIWGMRASQAAGRLIGSFRSRVVYL